MTWWFTEHLPPFATTRLFVVPHASRPAVAIVFLPLRHRRCRHGLPRRLAISPPATLPHYLLRAFAYLLPTATTTPPAFRPPSTAIHTA